MAQYEDGTKEYLTSHQVKLIHVVQVIKNIKKDTHENLYQEKQYSDEWDFNTASGCREALQEIMGNFLPLLGLIIPFMS